MDEQIADAYARADTLSSWFECDPLGQGMNWMTRSSWNDESYWPFDSDPVRIRASGPGRQCPPELAYLAVRPHEQTQLVYLGDKVYRGTRGGAPFDIWVETQTEWYGLPVVVGLGYENDVLVGSVYFAGHVNRDMAVRTVSSLIHDRFPRLTRQRCAMISEHLVDRSTIGELGTSATHQRERRLERFSKCERFRVAYELHVERERERERAERERAHVERERTRGLLALELLERAEREHAAPAPPAPHTPPAAPAAPAPPAPYLIEYAESTPPSAPQPAPYLIEYAESPPPSAPQSAPYPVEHSEGSDHPEGTENTLDVRDRSFLLLME